MLADRVWLARFMGVTVPEGFMGPGGIRSLDAHLFNHQTHHRGQITALLTQQGCDPGSTDLFAMLREEAARASVS